MVGSNTQCAFCGYPISDNPVRTSSGAICCSDYCRGSYEGGDAPYAGQFGFKRFSTGVSVLDSLLPQGIPTNSFVLLAGEEGIRHRSLQTELVWRTLTRGEPAVVMTFVDPPVAIVEHFLTFGWNVIPFLESGDLRIIDCFTSRLREDHQEPTHQVDWNEYLNSIVDEAVAHVHDTNNFRKVEDTLHAQLEEMGMMGQGLVAVDSLNEARAQGGEFDTKQFIKEVRGDICSRKFVPIFASTTRTGDQLADDSAYLFDGIVEMRHNESLVDGVRLKQISIRKLDGVLYRPHWVAYENSGAAGFQSFDPATEFSTVYGMQTTPAPRTN
jgi:KaiC/GvpD/RAD55 family RecA-like ATPase